MRGRREEAPEIPAEGHIPIGTKLRYLRWYKGLTIEEMAKALNYSYVESYIRQVENGHYHPSEEFLEQVCRALGVTVEALRAASRDTVIQWRQQGEKKQRERRAEKASLQHTPTSPPAASTAQFGGSSSGGGVQFGLSVLSQLRQQAAPATGQDLPDDVRSLLNQVAEAILEAHLSAKQRVQAERLILENVRATCRILGRQQEEAKE